jgi:iron(III) transport system ATP-binding protein
VTPPALAIAGLAVDRGGRRVLAGLDIEASPRGITAVLGPSGCGKTTLLRAIAGFEKVGQGEIAIGGRRVAGPGIHLPPEERRLGMVFQEGAIFPHLSVAENVAYGLRAGPRHPRVAEMLELVGLAALAGRRPHQLSGGEQQRLALARALAPRPDFLLLDEPFASLDAELRRRLREELAAILAAAGAAALLVTHDQEEALSLAGRVALLLGGAIVQAGSPEEIYARPLSATIAGFVGDGQLFPCRVENGVAATAFGRLPAEGPGSRLPAALALLRPEQMRLAAAGEAPAEARRGRLESSRFVGHGFLDLVRFPDGSAARVRRLGGGPSFAPGQEVAAELAGNRIWVVPDQPER